jgi:hypothetical protein
MAVHANYRNQGIAFALIREVIRHGVESMGFTSFKLSAQLTAMDFYKRSGFVGYGDQFIDAGIAHMDMFHMAPALWLAHAVHEGESARHPLCAGKDDSTWHFRTLEECRSLGRMILLQAKSKIDIYSQDLEPDLYGDAQMVDYISAVARAHPTTEVRILVADEKAMLKRHHALITLAERLPSKISIKLCDEDYPKPSAVFMIVDRYMVMHRQNSDLYEGFANFRAAGRVKALRDDFDLMWHRAKKSKEISPLGI